MGRHSKGPRLWLRPARADKFGKISHRAAWFILDGSRQIATGYCASEEGEANVALSRYAHTRPDRKIYQVYFITTVNDDFPVKIGVSSGYKSRLNTLQTSLPYQIKVLAVVPTQDVLFERRIHRDFADDRLCGEWFARTPRLLDYIEKLTRTHCAV